MRDAPKDPPFGPQVFPGELMIWLSPSFPVGGFAYSQGLETAVDRGWVQDRETLHSWILATIRFGALRNEMILMSLIMQAEAPSRIADLVELSAALQPTAERAAESCDQGRSFVAAYRAGHPDGIVPSNPFSDFDPLTLPAALSLASRAHGIDCAATLECFAIAYAQNLISAAIRLSVIGQFDGQRVIADLLPGIRDMVHQAAMASEDDLGSAAYGADLASMLHETQTTRLFRS